MRILQFTNDEDLKILTTKLKKCNSLNDYKIASDNKELFFEICRTSNGVGLSANQVGITKRFFVIYTDSLKELFINPIILCGQGMVINKEGCLSFNNGKKTLKKRFTNIEVQYENELKEKSKIKLNGLNAIVFQHELDHMDGKII